MNLEELRSVQSTERQKDSLQNLRPSFYEEVGEYIAALEAERDAVADRTADPFASPEVARLTDEIETAKDVVEAIYERRMGKLVKQASLAAAGMAADAEGLTAEEQALFDDLVERIETNKHRVLDVLDGRVDTAPTEDETTPSPPPNEPLDPSRRGENARDDATDEISAADLMGGDPVHEAGMVDDRSSQSSSESGEEASEPGNKPSTSGDERTELGEEATTNERVPTPPDDESAGFGDGAETHGDGTAGAGDETLPDGESAVGGEPRTGGEMGAGGARSDGRDDPDADVDRLTVQITADVGSILGVDDREYTLERDDVVTLPAANATPLIDRDAAEPLE